MAGIVPKPGISSEPSRRPIGEILIDLGILSEEQLKQALAEQREKGGALGTVLKDLGLVSEQEMLLALGQQMGMDPIDISSMNIDQDVVMKVDRMTAEAYKVIPVEFSEEENTLVIAMADPLNVHALDDLRFLLNCNVRGAISDEDSVRAAIDRFYGASNSESIEDLISKIGEDDMVEIGEEDGELDASTLETAANAVPVVKLLNLVLLSAIKDQSSDIHFEPFEDVFKIRYRIDGALLEMKSPPKSLALPLISRIKVMANLNIAERRVPQDGRIALSMGDKAIDLRVSTLPTMFGESVVIRVLDKTVVSLDINRLGMSEEILGQFTELIHKPNGIILVTGPTGSGKTTTLYACLNAVNDISQKIITTEDPVEYELPGIIQVPIHSDIGVTYAKCLRAILRQDPDKILVGEIRDAETAGIAIEASLTGHLVFSTLHTQDAPSTIARLVEMGIEPFLLSATIEAIVAQRLVRCICTRCKQAYTPTEEEIYEIGFSPEELADRKFYFGSGCETCKKTGYKGRNAIYEIMRMNQRLREMIIDKKSTELLRAAARESGMTDLRNAGLLKVFDGITTLEEVVRETLALE
ncbi:MAG: Flp pilus assembly complex ATPase component TadA [Planctomycetes bacterium]|nr:Flp pilus assembly complex ATPase component TadA [Planctomycetota bacterium]